MTQVVDPPAPAKVMSVGYNEGERYEIAVRKHTIVVDQPTDAGGSDVAPTPTELFVASLAGCVAYYAGRFLSRHGLPRDGLGVSVTYSMSSDRPARVADVHLTLRLPEALPVHQRPALKAVAEHCTVHNTLTTPPTVRVDLAE